jgi:hypothetical protein
MSRFIDGKCMHCEHLRFVVSQALAAQEEIVLNQFVPAYQRPFYATSVTPNVITDFILHFKQASLSFKFDEVVCFECTRDEVMSRLQRLNDEEFVLSLEDMAGVNESAEERVTRRGWELFASTQVSSNDFVEDNYAELQKVYEKQTSVVNWGDSDV